MEHEGLSDRECVERCLQGDRKAFGTLFDRYYESFDKFLQKTNNRLDEDGVLQETFVRAYEGLPKLKKPDQFEAWCRGIMKNVIKEQDRTAMRIRRMTGRNGLLAQKKTDDTMPAQTSEHTEELLKFKQEIQRLEFGQRQVLELRLEGKTLEKIASILGVDASTVHRRLIGVYAVLRERMKD